MSSHFGEGTHTSKSKIASCPKVRAKGLVPMASLFEVLYAQRVSDRILGQSLGLSSNIFGIRFVFALNVFIEAQISPPLNFRLKYTRIFHFWSILAPFCLAGQTTFGSVSSINDMAIKLHLPCQ